MPIHSITSNRVRSCGILRIVQATGRAWGLSLSGTLCLYHLVYPWRSIVLLRTGWRLIRLFFAVKSLHG